jgi:1-acyl-sn-glycerol-3-phosphate acyltransferase
MTVAAEARRVFWRAAFTVNGGLTVTGRLPRGGCVVVANHSSHADTAALLAALPSSARPVVAAAADYWFADGLRRTVCRTLVSGFPVRRRGGGSGDLAGALPLLHAGHAVVVFPEGTRSRDGSLGAFHSGALRLAAEAEVPVVPVGLAGTRDVLPVHGTLQRAPVEIRIGAPLRCVEPEVARAAVASLAAQPPSRADSAVRRRIAALACSRLGVALVAAWALAEALSWPLIPELLLAVLVSAAPRAGVRLSVTAAAASIAGGLLAYAAYAGGLSLPQPLTTPRMHATVAAQTAAEGAHAVLRQPLSGVPYKVYAAEAGRQRAGAVPFALESAQARGTRIVLVGLGLAAVAALVGRWRRFYPLYLTALVPGFGLGLARVVSSWS